MSVLTQRGGVPRIIRTTADTTGRKYLLRFKSHDLEGGSYGFDTLHIQIFNKGGNILRIFFIEDDFDNDENYIELAATTGAWEGPAELGDLWLKSTVGATDVEIVAFQRRA